MEKNDYNRAPGNLFLLLAAWLLPALLGIIFSYIIARQNVKQDLQATTLVIVHQTESISRQAWEMVDSLMGFEGQSCDAVSPTLIQQGTLSPYFRSVGLTQGRDMYCSSVSGNQRVPLKAIIQCSLPIPSSGNWNISLSETKGVQGRPAVIFAKQRASSFGAFAIVDAQYLIDFMSAIGNTRQYLLTIQFGDGYEIREGRDIADDNPIISPISDTVVSSHYPIKVSATVAAAEITESWRSAFFTFLPLSLILSLIFVSIIRSWQKRKMSLRDELRKGMISNEFAVHYQPIYDIAARSCIGVEALMRWYRPGGRSIRPDVFIPSAEAEGLIIPLTRHMFKLLADDVKHWRVPAGFHLGVNIAAEHVQHPDFVDDIRRLSDMLSPHKMRITLELTERSLITNTQDVVEKLAILRQEGFVIAVDDFGTGHCSLSYLQMFPLDYLKIDKAFVGTIDSAHNDTPVLDAIIGLSHRLALDMVAEGVNTRHEYRYLKQNGVKYLQGYLYARPMDSKALMAWLQSRRVRPVKRES
ncbi:cyclic diguanylate phosphodiesterase [Brenneria izadpanahii]|uniref:cyclic-guanylate-specific phosphodiesterase n=1 Tax=Brenneria izadpanahii TaxID=2722756 RepID=A0ABX7UTI7_9GAMM|nr:cyclic diguanylate phosphodiesterase [Brenneria izadpanahii]QTF09053.1 cyclic diguanylate phosphodiesterase [Brenneria izadpanahii]